MRLPVLAVALASLVTVPQHDGQRSNLDAPYASVSANGRYVALVSYDRLVAADVNDHRDVYVLDRTSGSVSLESLPLDGAVPERGDGSDRPALSGDGRFLVYENGERIVWRDRAIGTTAVLAVGREPAISADGRVVAFTASDGITVFDTTTHATRNVSVDRAGRAVPNASSSPSLSGDGRFLAFTSTGALVHEIAKTRDLINSPRRRPLTQVYVRDLLQNVTKLVSLGMDGKAGDGDSWAPAISGDGCAVAFVSAAANLIKGDRNHSADVFLLTLADGSVDLVSRNVKGGPSNGASGRPAVSVDGQFVAFQSNASDLVKPGDDINLLWDVFLFERRAGTVIRLSTDRAGEWMEASGGPAIDAAGDVVAFSSRHPMDALDWHNDFDLFVLNLPVRPSI